MPSYCAAPEEILVGLMSLNTRTWPMPPQPNEKRAQFVLSKIDQILEWERQTDHERDTRFIELGRYLCEVRAGQYWRLENLASFDDYLARRFPESRRKAYYLMSIHEQLPRQVRSELKQVGWSKAAELAKWRGGSESTSKVQTGCTKRKRCRTSSSKKKSRST
jgi:hypothetical protein